MVTGKQPISSAVRVLVLIALAAELGTAPVLAELELVQELAVEPLAIGQAAARERVIVRGAEPVLVIALAEVEPGHDPVAAEPVPNQLRAQLAVLARTKSVTAAHHRGLVAARRVEDLAAAAAETMHAPVAAEVGTAWEAAATAVVVVAVAVAVEA